MAQRAALPAPRCTPPVPGGAQAGSADLVKANLGHGVYALPQENLPPSVSVTIASVDGEGETRYTTGSDTFGAATVGQAWTGLLDAIDSDGTRFYWEVAMRYGWSNCWSRPKRWIWRH